ncbi:MAG: hypothetical protein U9O94_05315 [Nanoarchaeota archaeon]|nr:hypothetical protein [Nanoarchaeota archaeon]
MKTVELFVGLKIPDTTAITTFHTIEKMGHKIQKLTREMYYKFDIDGNEKKFAEKIGKVDILVNANKNKFVNSIEKEEGASYLLVKDSDDKCEGLLHTLKERLGLSEIKGMEKGVLWTLHIDSDNKEEVAKEIGNKLLHNENYQEMEML